MSSTAGCHQHARLLCKSNTQAAFIICICGLDRVSPTADRATSRMLCTACCSLKLPLVCRHQQQTGCDIVTGTRYKAQGGVCGWNFKRKLVSRGANFLAQTLLNPGVRTMCGFDAKPLEHLWKHACWLSRTLIAFKPCQWQYELHPAFC